MFSTVEIDHADSSRDATVLGISVVATFGTDGAAEVAATAAMSVDWTDKEHVRGTSRHRATAATAHGNRRATPSLGVFSSVEIDHQDYGPNATALVINVVITFSTDGAAAAATAVAWRVQHRRDATTAPA